MTDEARDALAARQRADELAHLTKTIDLGLQFERLCESPLWRYLTLRAESERTELVERLVELDPDVEQDRIESRRIRQRIAAIDCWQQWVAEAIAMGDQAKQQFIDEGTGP